MDNDDKMMMQMYLKEEAHATVDKQHQLLILANLLRLDRR
jgi:hypothetical protein